MDAFIHMDGVDVIGEVPEAFRDILTPDALRFVASLARKFDSQRKALLQRRQLVQAEIDDGRLLEFLPETLEIREKDWKIASVPTDLQDRRVEITGPVDRKMIINALNSGASTFMADFEDSHSPTWPGTIQGQINLRDAVNGTICFDESPGKRYRLEKDPAVLIVRPRGWHLEEKHVLVDGMPISGSLFDYGLFLFHNARILMSNGSGPYFYLPKLENYLEARLWNDIFITSEQMLSIPAGSIKATVLIETLPAAFQIDEILYALKAYIVGLNCGRWDYIFSFIKRFRNVPGYIFPDRSQISMTRHCMHSYSLLVIQKCHRRGAHAMGGMAAQIPIKDDFEKNIAAIANVRADKQREATDGHDGTWVAHPGLVAVAREEFDRIMPGPNQIDVMRPDITVSAADLLKVPEGRITEQGLRNNISIGIQYMANWLAGNGCVPLNHLMEDAATAEISRTQVWQWVHHPRGILNDGRQITLDLFHEVMAEEMGKIRRALGGEHFERMPYPLASKLFDEIISNPELEEFLTLRAYEYLE